MFNHKNHTFLTPAHLGRRYPVNGIFAYQNKTADKMCGKSVGIIWFHYFSCHPSCGYNERWHDCPVRDKSDLKRCMQKWRETIVKEVPQSETDSWPHGLCVCLCVCLPDEDMHWLRAYAPWYRWKAAPVIHQHRNLQKHCLCDGEFHTSEKNLPVCCRSTFRGKT